MDMRRPQAPVTSFAVVSGMGFGVWGLESVWISWQVLVPRKSIPHILGTVISATRDAIVKRH